ncbi:hypothetical protein [Lysinibacillus sp. RC79]|uniref:hypothetical protein n=1 Tax=Lysinibacillus sp. RC79 TaxID=3156296 RepID=UPI0035114527
MDVYDAKQPQTCLICGFTIDHNKQGRFTSHLKNEHNFTNVKKRIINALLATT